MLFIPCCIFVFPSGIIFLQPKEKNCKFSLKCSFGANSPFWFVFKCLLCFNSEGSFRCVENSWLVLSYFLLAHWNYLATGFWLQLSLLVCHCPSYWCTHDCLSFKWILLVFSLWFYFLQFYSDRSRFWFIFTYPAWVSFHWILIPFI